MPFLFIFIFDSVVDHTGIFPGKCYAIPAREITPEELIAVIDFYVTLMSMCMGTYMSLFPMTFLFQQRICKIH